MRYWLHLRWVQTSDLAREQFLLRAARVLATYLDETHNPLPLCIDDVFVLDALEAINAELYARVVTGVQAGHIFVGAWYAAPFRDLVDDATLAYSRLLAARLAERANQIEEPDVVVMVYGGDTVESLHNRLVSALAPDAAHVGFVIDSVRGMALAIEAVEAMGDLPESTVHAPQAADYGARPRLFQAYKQCEALIMKALPLMEALAEARQGYPVSGYLRRRLMPASAAPLVTGIVSDAIMSVASAELEALAHTAREALRDSAQGLTDGQEGTTIVVVNANDAPKTDVVTVDFDLGGREPIKLRDVFADLAVTCTPVYFNNGRMSLQFIATDVPPWGARLYAVEHGADYDSAIDDGQSLENTVLSVSLDPHTGSVTVFDKRSGNLHEGLNHYHDGGDCGTLTRHETPQQDTVIAVPTNSPLPHRRLVSEDTQTLEVLSIYRVPEGLTDDGSARLPLTAQFVPISVTTYYTLHRDLPRLDIEMIVETTAKNHRLGTVFPLSAGLDTVLYDGMMGLERVEDVREPLFLRAKSFMTFGSGGTAVSVMPYANQSAMLYQQHDQWVLDLTLLRSTDWSDSGPGGFAAPKAQNTGSHTFYASVIFHDEAAEEAAWRLHEASTSLVGTAVPGVPVDGLDLSGLVTRCDGLRVLSVEPDITGQGIIVRGVVTDEAGAVMCLGRPVEEAILLDGRDLPTHSLAITDRNMVPIDAVVGAVVALRLRG